MQHPAYPDTILFESNFEKVMEAVQQLVDAQGCETIEEMAELDYDKLYCDPEFTISAESIYRKGDVPDDKALLLEEKLKKVEWFRPQ